MNLSLLGLVSIVSTTIFCAFTLGGCASESPPPRTAYVRAQPVSDVPAPALASRAATAPTASAAPTVQPGQFKHMPPPRPGWAPSSASSPEQVVSRYGPSAPPKETATSPPSARSALISPMIRESVSGIVPPHSGTQPALLPSMKARVKVFCPVACSIWASVGVDWVMSMYGATFQLSPLGGGEVTVLLGLGEAVVPVGVGLLLAVGVVLGVGEELEAPVLGEGPAGPDSTKSSAKYSGWAYQP